MSDEIGREWITQPMVNIAKSLYNNSGLLINSVPVINPNGYETNKNTDEALGALTDALADSDCPSAFLAHLRGHGTHYKGCHVIDHILGHPQ